MKSTAFYKNQFRSEFNYADAVKYVDDRTIRSVNLSTPQDQAEENWQQLQYEDAVHRAQVMERRDAKLRAQDAIASFVIVLITFLGMAAVIAHYSH